LPSSLLRPGEHRLNLLYTNGPSKRICGNARELAFQIHEQFVALGTAINLHSTVAVGGMDMVVQANELRRRPHVVIATPGRLADLLRSNEGEFNLGRAKFLVSRSPPRRGPYSFGVLIHVHEQVLDEADRMLSSTFADDLGYIIGHMPKERQTLLFTATVTESILALQKRDPPPGKEKPFLHLSHDQSARPVCDIRN
jgi:ATP-dependent RNA helicase DDX49/DBP8